MSVCCHRRNNPVICWIPSHFTFSRTLFPSLLHHQIFLSTQPWQTCFCNSYLKKKDPLTPIFSSNHCLMSFLHFIETPWKICLSLLSSLSCLPRTFQMIQSRLFPSPFHRNCFYKGQLWTNPAVMPSPLSYWPCQQHSSMEWLVPSLKNILFLVQKAGLPFRISPFFTFLNLLCLLSSSTWSLNVRASKDLAKRTL